MLIASSEFVEADATAFLDLFDAIPLGAFLALATELRGVTSQRSALTGMLFFQLRRMRQGAGRQVAPTRASMRSLKVANASEVEKGRAPFDQDAYRRSPAGRLALGRELLAKKATLPRGYFGPWLREQPYGSDFARTCMRMAREAGEAKAA